jgi:hypothetical protein
VFKALGVSGLSRTHLKRQHGKRSANVLLATVRTLRLDQEANVRAMNFFMSIRGCAGTEKATRTAVVSVINADTPAQQDENCDAAADNNRAPLVAGSASHPDRQGSIDDKGQQQQRAQLAQAYPWIEHTSGSASVYPKT